MKNFDLIIPTRNAPEILWLTLTHLMAYSPLSFINQAIILDNLSTAPGSEDVLNFARSCGFTVIRNERNVGVWASVNRGLTLSRSPWVVVVTSDVLYGPRGLESLVELTQTTQFCFLGLEVVLGMQALPVLAFPPLQEVNIDTSTYNGASWAMNWEMLKQEVGYFDPQFYVCAGDTDYSERLRLKQIPFGVVRGLPCIHLDKQTRRHDESVQGDTEMEIQDMTRFREKWKDHPEVLARHSLPTQELWNQFKGGEEGWKGAIPQ